MKINSKSKLMKRYNNTKAKAYIPASNRYFEKFGFNWTLSKNIQYKGYKMLTPIQRKVIPLILNGKNVIATSRTGSGKTAAFLLPILQNIVDYKSVHNKLKINGLGASVKAIIISPTRELAIQTFKFAKEFSKNLNVQVNLILGGDSMDDQFSLFHNRETHSLPDMLIATPGRLIHIFDEMGIGKLSNVSFLVLDEADRLLELGFAPQIANLVRNHLNVADTSLTSGPLGKSLQILLFSATFSSQMAETFTNSGSSLDGQVNIFPEYDSHSPSAFVFAKCDTDYKISPKLEMHFIACKGNNYFASGPSSSPDKLKCLLYLLAKHLTDNYNNLDERKPKKGFTTTSTKESENCHEIAFPDRTAQSAKCNAIATLSKIREKPAIAASDVNKDNLKIKSTASKSGNKILVFLPTKYHVDYIRELLSSKFGIEVVYVYSSLDPAARKLNLNKFREGQVEVLLVTDIAARGLDIPLLDCVINFTFPTTPKLFLHRIGRVARAGNSGVAYSLVSHLEVPHVLDFLDFIGHDLIIYRAGIHRSILESERLDQGDSRPFHLFGNVPDYISTTHDSSTLISSESINSFDTDNFSHLTSSSDSKDYDLNYLATICDRAMSKFEKSRSKPSRDSIRKGKSELIELGGAAILKPSPIFYTNEGTDGEPKSAVNAKLLDEKLEFLQQLKRYKNRDTSQKLFKTSSTFPNNLPNLESICDPSKDISDSRKKIKSMSPLQPHKNPHPPATTNSYFSKSKFADPRLFIPYAPEKEEREDRLLDTPESNILDLQLDDTGKSGNMARKNSGAMNTNKSNKMVWDTKRKRFVHQSDLNSKKTRFIINESGVRVKVLANRGAGNNQQQYQKWLQKTAGGQIANSAVDYKDDETTGDLDQTKLNTSRGMLLKKDWRFKSQGPARPINKSKHTTAPINAKSKRLNAKNLGLKRPEQAFKVRYAKEQKQAFQTYRRNLNSAKKSQKSKKSGRKGRR